MRIRIKDLRVQAHLTQSDLATRSGLTRATISNLESGRVQNANATTLLRLARALGCTIDDLFSA